jgi:hypothetical protein
MRSSIGRSPGFAFDDLVYERGNSAEILREDPTITVPVFAISIASMNLWGLHL